MEDAAGPGSSGAPQIIPKSLHLLLQPPWSSAGQKPQPQLHSPPHSPHLTHRALSTLAKWRVRCIPITPTVNFQVHLLHKSLSSQGKAEKDKLSRFPVAILVSSLTTPNQCLLPVLPSPPPLGEPDHDHGTLHHLTLILKCFCGFFSFSTTAAQGWTDLQE